MSTAPDHGSSGLRGGRLMELQPGGPWHEAMPYTSPADLAGLLAGPVGAAVTAGDLVLAVLGDEAEQLLRTELGATADGVEFLLPGSRAHRPRVHHGDALGPQRRAGGPVRRPRVHRRAAAAGPAGSR